MIGRMRFGEGWVSSEGDYQVEVTMHSMGSCSLGLFDDNSR